MSLILFVNILLVLSLADTVQISTPQGELFGTTRTTLNGREVYAFLGIPFAKPPIGELRFKNPEPFGPWEGIRNCTEDGPHCIQINIFAGKDPYDRSDGVKIDILGTTNVSGSEDCLYLNVFTPSVDEPNRYPVMVNIHGGGFFGGSGSSMLYGPEYLLDKDIVLVSMNYRLGALGFASTEDAEMSGNWGLKDQSLALKWVQENIAAYGGNPESVTIFGISAGGASVDHNAISPLSKGLFHRAIAMSGTAHVPWAIKSPGTIAKRTKKLASILDCPEEPSSALVACLRKIPPENLIKIRKQFAVWNTDPFVVFTPVVEPEGLDGAFLTKSPDSSISTVPMIIGVVNDEGGLQVGLWSYSNLEERLSDLDENFLNYGSVTLLYDNEGQMTTEMLKKIRKFYFGDNKISRKQFKNVVDMFSDAWFVYGATSAARRHKGPAYFYNYSYKSDFRFSELFFPKQDDDFKNLVNHGDDSVNLFYPSMFTAKENNRTNNDIKMVDMIISMWTNFAIYGNPTPKGLPVVWNKFSKSEMNYLNIDLKNMKMEKNFLAKRDRFWQELFQKKSTSSNARKSEL